MSGVDVDALGICGGDRVQRARAVSACNQVADHFGAVPRQQGEVIAGGDQ
ncbi:hypothetical protein ABIB25_003680 [Nakamurella sp. UYEF19]